MSSRNKSAPRPVEAQYELRHLRHLVAVHEHGTLAGAAEHLAISQSALTKSIQRLESALGAELFDRSGRRLLLNTLGHLVLARAETLLRVADDVQREAHMHAAGEAGEVLLGVGPVVALSRLPAALGRFCARSPGVTVRVESGSTESLVPRLLTGALHFVVADYGHRDAHPEVQVTPLEADPIGVGAATTHPLQRAKRPLTLEQALRYPVCAATAPPRIREWLRTREDGARLEATLTCDNYEVLVSVVEQTDTVVLGPLSMLRRYAAAGRLAVLPVTYPSPPSEPAVLSVRGRPLGLAAQGLMRELQAPRAG